MFSRPAPAVRRGATVAASEAHPPATLDMVASRAGVSRATASRVVNGLTSVDPKIRDRVIRAVSELGYVPNQAARSLVTHRSDSFGLVLAEARSRVFSDDQFFPGLILGIGQELDAADQ
jgi:DNA-binding LacI/PurR family transcriptional regulator